MLPSIKYYKVGIDIYWIFLPSSEIRPKLGLLIVTFHVGFVVVVGHVPSVLLVVIVVGVG
jgi:hypothetical protein